MTVERKILVEVGSNSNELEKALSFHQHRKPFIVLYQMHLVKEESLETTNNLILQCQERDHYNKELL